MRESRGVRLIATRKTLLHARGTLWPCGLAGSKSPDSLPYGRDNVSRLGPGLPIADPSEIVVAVVGESHVKRVHMIADIPVLSDFT